MCLLTGTFETMVYLYLLGLKVSKLANTRNAYIHSTYQIRVLQTNYIEYSRKYNSACGQSTSGVL